MTANKFVWMVSTKDTPTGMRRGQFLFNELDRVNRTLSTKLINGPDRDRVDPFYDDSKIPNFIGWVLNNW